MSAPQIRWVKIAATPTELLLNREGLAEVYADGKKICVALYGDRLFACAPTCPHASGLLSEGRQDGLGNIVCPLHRYTFNLSNGRNTSGEGYFLKTYLVEQRPDGIYVGFEEKKWLNW